MFQSFISITTVLLTAQKLVFLPALYPSNITLNTKHVGNVTASRTLFSVTLPRRHTVGKCLKAQSSQAALAAGTVLPAAPALLPHRGLGGGAWARPAPGGGRHLPVASSPNAALKL